MIRRNPLGNTVTLGLTVDVGTANGESAFFAQAGNGTAFVCFGAKDSPPERGPSEADGLARFVWRHNHRNGAVVDEVFFRHPIHIGDRDLFDRFDVVVDRSRVPGRSTLATIQRPIRQWSFGEIPLPPLRGAWSLRLNPR